MRRQAAAEPQDAAPADERAERPGQRAAGDLPDDGEDQQPAQRHLAVLERHRIADRGQGQRHDPARRGAGQGPQRDQHAEAGGEGRQQGEQGEAAQRRPGSMRRLPMASPIGPRIGWISAKGSA